MPIPSWWSVSWRLTVLLLLNGAAVCLGAEPTDAPSAEDRQASAQRLVVMESLAKACQLSREAQSPPYVLEANPLLRWSNPVSGVVDGSLWLWTYEGRPVATVDVFTMTNSPSWSHQWQSLAETPLRCQRDGQVRWSPQQPGVAFQWLPDAPTPAATAAGRLIQMRALAREFTVEDDFKTRFRGTEFHTHELRLLAQPLYRYGKDGTGTTDGALFAFVLGTACEALLMLEVREQNGQPAWLYAFAGQTSYEVRAKRNDETVWSQPCWDNAFDVNNPYFAFSVRPETGGSPTPR